MKTDIIEILNSKIKNIKVAMLTTMDNGILRCRPMSTNAIDENGNLWFFTDDYSHKMEEIQQDNHVCLGYSNHSDNTYISISGTSEIIGNREKIRELWNPVLKAWFPNGVDDPKIALLKITITQAEYWDAHESKMVQLFEIAKAMVSGDKFSVGQNQKLNFKTN